jgi:pimeloyl-ACP methyl ester carboxylesterase
MTAIGAKRWWMATVSDGRRVAVTEYGDPGGRPTILFHGTPLCARGYGWFVDAPARRLGLRVLCPDRPGVDRSDPLRGRTIRDCVADVTAVADAAAIGEFLVLAHSCGAPFALATAATHPDRVGSVTLVGGAGPVDDEVSRSGLSSGDRRLLDLSMRRPLLAALAMRASVRLARWSPTRALAAIASDLSEADRRTMDRHGRAFVAAFAESMRHGPRGVIDDYRCWGGRWEFAWSDVRAPVHLWQGDADRIIAMAHAKRLARLLPGSVLHPEPGHGHFSIADRMETILQTAVRAV